MARTAAPRGLVCPEHQKELIDSGFKSGPKTILKCPVLGCPTARIKPPRTPKRAKDLVLTQIPYNEHEEQARLILETQDREKEWPEASLLFAIPNGGYRGQAEGRKMVQEGAKGGVPDLFLPVARGGKHGLFVEMKKILDPQTQAAQKRWHKALLAQGFAVEVCLGWKVAWSVICNYLETK